MSPEVALLHDLWDTLRSYIPAKERVEVAESIVRTFDENLDIADVTVDINEFDSIMKTAIRAHFDDGFEDEEDEEY